MKKGLYAFLLIIEIFVGFLAMSLVYGNLGWVPCIVTGCIVIFLLAILLYRLKNHKEVAQRKKTLTWIALVLLIPTFATFLLAVYVIVSMMLYFG